jgi:cell wall integrity and stress response component
LTESRKSSTNVGAIVGGVVGGVAVIGAIIGGILFYLHRRRRQQLEADVDRDGQSGVQRNVSTMSKAGLLRMEKNPQYPPPIATSFNRRTSRHMDAESVSPISGSDRRSSRPYIFDQRLNPSAIMAMDNGSRGSFASLDDSRDYGRELNVSRHPCLSSTPS